MGYIYKEYNRPSQKDGRGVAASALESRLMRNVLPQDSEHGAIRWQIEPVAVKAARKAVAGKGRHVAIDVEPDGLIFRTEIKCAEHALNRGASHEREHRLSALDKCNIASHQS